MTQDNNVGEKGEALRIVMVAGEHSGDQLGARLMETLQEMSSREISFAGVGGEMMAGQGLVSFFPLSDVAVMGITEIVSNLPRIVRRVYQSVDETVSFRPDIVVIIDSPEFTHPVAKRIRKKLPAIPVINYVSPSVWAWRPGRARRMKPYINHVLGLLPFEPEAYRRLDGPQCSYVGHPLIEKLDFIGGLDMAAFLEQHGLDKDRPVLVVLPGSRTNEVRFLMKVFGETVGMVREKTPDVQVIIPAVAHVRGLIEQELSDWTVRPLVVEGEEQKFMAFRLATAALAASGTVTLELGIVGVPMVVGYRTDRFTNLLRPLIKVHSVVLANLVLGKNVFPEFLQEDCTSGQLLAALSPLLSETAERQQHLDGLDRIRDKMLLEGTTPSQAAARIVMDHLPE